MAVAGATTVATIAVASGVAAAAPDGPASKTAPSRPAAGMAVLDSTSATWGLGYIQSVYGSPCAAWSHEQSAGWY